MTAVEVRRQQVLAFRAATHGLDRRRPAAALAEVAGACGIQDTPPGSADVALAARLDVAGPVVAGAVAARDLVLTWSLRGAPHVFPAADLAVFTLGALPADGKSLEAVIGGAARHLAGVAIDPMDALARVEEAMLDALGPEPRTKAEVSAAVTAGLEPELAPWCRACAANHPPDGVFRTAALAGRFLLTATSPVTLARTATWLGAEPAGDLDRLRRDLLVRYLRCYGPTTAGHFAAWAGIGPADARRRWRLVEPELVAVEVEGRPAAVLEDDLDRVMSAPPVTGVRLLPAKDALLQARDRELLVPDATSRRAAFTVLDGPGVVLVDGYAAGLWRGTAKGTAKGRRYEVRVRPFRELSKAAAALDEEAQRVAVARGHERAAVVGWT